MQHRLGVLNHTEHSTTLAPQRTPRWEVAVALRQPSLPVPWLARTTRDGVAFSEVVRHGLGNILLISLLVLSGLLTLATVSISRSSTGLLAARRFLAGQQAFHAAEGRVDHAIVTLEQEPGLTGPCPAIPDPPFGTSTCTMTDRGDGTRLITASGFVPNAISPTAQRDLDVVVEVQANSPFRWAAFAKTRMEVGTPSDAGGVVDSYDSRLGGYGAVLSQPDAKYGSLNQSHDSLESSWGADIRINGNGPTTESDIIKFGANYRIYGAAMTRATPASGAISLHSSTTIKKGNAGVTAPEDYLPPPIQVPSGSPAGSRYGCSNTSMTMTVQEVINTVSAIDTGANCHITITGDGTIHLDWVALDSGSSLTLDGDITLVSHGTYDPTYNAYDPAVNFGSDSRAISLANDASIKVTTAGSAKVYALDVVKLKAGNSINNLTHNPTKFSLFVQGGFKADGTDGIIFYGSLYAPDSTVDLGKNAQVYGSLIANQLNANTNTRIHFDEALAQAGSSGGSATVTVRAWAER